ncbi:hypothetical protein GW933_04040 [Candidatus Falkowbacteria bacterium]|uniref:DUF2178 domain-containing protein n=1 Tax=Candidatus Buchananbacteria bacterium CG10_big_fil_rev_8_21_14_0_10_33_19 TaxID=1974525 RepID=A0A2H0W791_9BACT|nr:hypothetical protein [Candidatus Falkowbacteria bacterium]PIS06490.1 MAG: hypothetical protein COT80_00955 [Candidatus Buchananbacteria bacterium CG10_big_fil_rev_8_21_14_0_10_33_19]
MKNKLILEIFIALVLVVLLVFCLNPFNLWMPDMIVTIMAMSLIVVFSIFSVFIWQEQAGDERELFHRMLAGRIAYLVGSSVLVLGIIVQSFKHQVDIWLVVTLVFMILAKIFGNIYSRIKY